MYTTRSSVFSSRRQGAEYTFLNGRRIRKYDDGTDVFEDYWTDSADHTDSFDGGSDADASSPCFKPGRNTQKSDRSLKSNIRSPSLSACSSRITGIEDSCGESNSSKVPSNIQSVRQSPRLKSLSAGIVSPKTQQNANNSITVDPQSFIGISSSAHQHSSSGSPEKNLLRDKNNRPLTKKLRNCSDKSISFCSSDNKSPHKSQLKGRIHAENQISSATSEPHDSMTSLSEVEPLHTPVKVNFRQRISSPENISSSNKPRLRNRKAEISSNEFAKRTSRGKRSAVTEDLVLDHHSNSLAQLPDSRSNHEKTDNASVSEEASCSTVQPVIKLRKCSLPSQIPMRELDILPEKSYKENSHTQDVSSGTDVECSQGSSKKGNLELTARQNQLSVNNYASITADDSFSKFVCEQHMPEKQLKSSARGNSSTVSSFCTARSSRYNQENRKNKEIEKSSTEFVNSRKSPRRSPRNHISSGTGDRKAVVLEQTDSDDFPDKSKMNQTLNEKTVLRSSPERDESEIYNDCPLERRLLAVSPGLVSKTKYQEISRQKGVYNNSETTSRELTKTPSHKISECVSDSSGSEKSKHSEAAATERKSYSSRDVGANPVKRLKQNLKRRSSVSQKHLAEKKQQKGKQNNVVEKKHQKTMSVGKSASQGTEDLTEHVRRSSRNRIRPLDYWRNERLLYKFTKSGDVQCVGLEPGSQAELAAIVKTSKKGVNKTRKAIGVAKMARRRRRRKEVPTAVAKVPEDQLYKSYIEKGLTAYDYETCEDVRAKLVVPYESLTWKLPDPKSGAKGFSISKAFTLDDAAVGYLRLSSLQHKPLQCLQGYDAVFFIIKGRIEVRIYRSCLILKEYDTFIVPRGNPYSLTNLVESEALLSFVAVNKTFMEELRT